MKIWRRLMQGVGAISLFLSLSGYCLLIAAIWRVLHQPMLDPQLPLFRAAFFTMSVLDALLLTGMVLVAVRLMKLERKAAANYMWLILAMIAYKSGLGVLWLLPDPIGRSIGAASGIGSMGLALLLLYPIPFVYPLVSVMIVNLARYELRTVVESNAPASSSALL
jgi:hypothetical protein